MAHFGFTDPDTAQAVLALNNDEVAGFVQQCVRNRSLSKIVNELNRAALSGAPRESQRATKALHHLGFCDD
ncbi:MAG: hypothetical protein AB8B47_05710 [Roseobacter sp.]